MTIRHLKIFVAVCRTGSVTLAGEKLFIAQPSISLAISELEKYYGLKLFDRIGRKLKITSDGKRLLEYASHIVNLFDDMENIIKNPDNKGELKIGTSITIGTFLLPKFVSMFNQIYPNIKVRVIINNTDTIQEYIMDNKVDIGIVEGIITNGNIVCKDFFEDELILICSNNHLFANRDDISIDELDYEDLILRENGSSGRDIFDSILGSYGKKVIPLWESESTQAIINAVSYGIGISVLPYFFVKEQLEAEKISSFRLKDVTFNRKYVIIYHKHKYITDGMKTFIEICENEGERVL